MKKTLLLIATVLCCAMTMFAQNNNKISYQAVVRDTENKLVANKSVEVTVNIYNGTATTAAYTETQTVTTNLNGLISLMIGPDVETPAWNSIQWNQARIVTTVTLDNTPLGTLAMPLTAVPYAMYAEYADELDPDAAVVIGIYNKILYDSLALGALIDANAANIGELQEMDEALSARITADSNNLVIFKAKVKTDSTTLRNLINTNAAKIGELQEMDEALSARIAADSNNLVIFKAKVKTDSTTLRNLINTNADNITITNTNLTALQNRVNTFNTTVCDSVDACVKRIVSDTASALRGLIKDTDDKFANYYTKTQTDINIRDTANTVREEMSAQLATKADANNVYTKAEVDALLQTINETIAGLPKMNQQDSVIAATQTSTETVFTLARTVNTNCIYRMYINGVMVGGSHDGVLVPVTGEGNKVKYDGTKNGGYMLKANDKVTIVYWY